MVTKRLNKVTHYPRPHTSRHIFSLSANIANKQATIYPWIHNDEGLGDPTGYNANPRHASFAEVSESNCYPESRINNGIFDIELSLTKACWATDNIEVVKVLVMPIMMSFDDYTAQHTGTSDEVQDILEMQTDGGTNREAYPLYNGTDLAGDYTTMSTKLNGLTTDAKLEAVTFSTETLYDALQYYNNSGKIRKCIGQPRWVYISRRKTKHIKFRLNGKNKSMQDYSFFGCLIYVPLPATASQVFQTADTSAVEHVLVKSQARFNEWNENFDMART